ncbi:MAG: outer membrane lipoprotein-sorting protein [Pseudohongiellaceae bacterium]|nr:outer membrane lipoprotein-sorting protein [Pseudohongiellaceae bacterium]
MIQFGRVKMLSLLLGILSTTAMAQEGEMTALDIVDKINGRDDGAFVTRSLTIELTDRRGISRVEKTVGYRKYFDDEKRTVLFYTDPSNVRGTGFLTFDYSDAEQDDDQWLYLPALRKVRRISSSNRGDYFLGTDLTYEEIKKENKLETQDYVFSLKGEAEIDGRSLVKIEATPVDSDTADELGYSKVLLHVDTEVWMSRRSEFWDLNGNALKTVENSQIEMIDGIWTTLKVDVENHKTSHKTSLTFSDVDYKTPIDDDLFSQSSLRRGLR